MRWTVVAEFQIKQQWKKTKKTYCLALSYPLYFLQEHQYVKKEITSAAVTPSLNAFSSAERVAVIMLSVQPQI